MDTATAFPITDLRDTLSTARLCRDVSWVLDGPHPERSTIVDACNQYPVFFQTLRPGMYIAFVTLTATVFDGRPDCITLKSVPGIVTMPGFKDLWDRGRLLHKQYRSKCIAHRDIENGTRNSASETGFSRDWMNAVLDDTCTIYDDYCISAGYPTLVPTTFSASDDLLNLMRRISK